MELPRALTIVVRTKMDLPIGMCSTPRPMRLWKLLDPLNLCWCNALYYRPASNAQLIHQAGIVRVVYGQTYKDTTGLEFLQKAGVELELLEVQL